MMKELGKSWITTALLSLAVVSVDGQNMPSGGNPTNRSFVEYFKSIAMSENRTPQEKVYLHLDNNAYMKRETIWFKAYVVRASSLSPTTLSKVLYVELLNSEGEIVQRKVLEVVKGQAYGEFELVNLVHSGFYEIRAYTREMLNWGGSVAFSRVIPIYDENVGTTTGKFGELKMYEVPLSERMPSKRPDPMPYRDGAVVVEKGYALGFYPEGGDRIAGMTSRVAYKLTNKKGGPETRECSVYDAAGTLLAKSTPLHEGMGIIDVPAQAIYAQVAGEGGTSVRFELPKPQPEGCTMRTESSGDNVEVLVTRSAAFAKKTLGFSVTSRGAACYFDTLITEKNRLTIPYSNLREGINQFTLFAIDGSVLAERFVWKEPMSTDAVVSVQQNALAFKPFNPVTLNFFLKDKKQNNVGGVFSVSVQDAEGYATDNDAGIKQNLLLTSDLRGYVANPGYYFKGNDPNRLKALDLLLMVQGWRRYNWKEMAEVEPFELKHPVEDGLLIAGSIQEPDKKRKPMVNADVTLFMFLNGKMVIGSSVTDSLGNFSMAPPAFQGDIFGRFETKLEGKIKNSRILLDRRFRPALRPYDPMEVAKKEPMSLDPKDWPLPLLFEWKDTFNGKLIALPEARVQKKKNDDYYTGRYTWGGGEKFGKSIANIYYYIEDEIEELQDAGEKIPLIWEWLQSRNKYFEFEYGDVGGTVKYKNKKAHLFLNNDSFFEDYDIFADGVKSVIIVENPVKIFNEETGMPFQGPCILVYTYPPGIGTGIYEPKKGERITRLHGYAEPAEFYSPDYRKDEVPVLTDYRRTVFWAPNVVANAQGQATVNFYSNARDNMKARVSVQGITFKGGLIEKDK